MVNYKIKLFLNFTPTNGVFLAFSCVTVIHARLNLADFFAQASRMDKAEHCAANPISVMHPTT